MSFNRLAQTMWLGDENSSLCVEVMKICNKRSYKFKAMSLDPGNTNVSPKKTYYPGETG